MKIPLFCQQMAKEWYFLLAKHCSEEFKLDCQFRWLTERIVKEGAVTSQNRRKYSLPAQQDVHSVYIRTILFTFSTNRAIINTSL